jgi:hypothetical protein
MKKVILSAAFILLLCSISLAQRDEKKDPREKIEALEKIKLLETLDMDEETAIKFFSRRNDHKEKIKDMFNELDSERNKIRKKVKTLHDDNDPGLKKLVENYFVIQQKIDEEKKNFISSLTDILTVKQIAELTLFERRFREEIRDILYKHRKGKRIDKEQY